MTSRARAAIAAVLTAAAATAGLMAPAHAEPAGHAAAVAGARVGSSAYAACPYAAHRGDHTTWTENSIRAFRAAVAHHANYLETDVQVTEDGYFVLMHDPTVDRTTRGSASWTVLSHTLKQVKALRLLDGQRVPTLAGLFSMVEPTDAKVLVELKWIPHARWDRLVSRITELGLDRVVVNQFSRKDLLRFHRAYPQVRTTLDSDVALPVADAAPYGSVMVDYHRATDAWLQSMDDAGIAVQLWTLNTPDAWRRFAGRVELVVTNKPQEYDAWRATAPACAAP